MSQPSFIGVDWGTSSFRLWLLSADGTALSESRGPDGMLFAARDGFANVLLRHLKAAKAPADLPVLVCGMAGARGGWVEAGYVETPTPLDAIANGAIAAPGIRRDIRILPGLCQRDSSRPDVIRGEETQLLGAAASLAGNAHVVMPGTHSKWVTIEAGRVNGFSTFMTGELYDAITQHTILAPAKGVVAEGPESPAFAKAVSQAFAEPGRLTSWLFAARAGQLLGGLSPAGALAHISGTLIGAEIGGATNSATTPEERPEVRLVASGRLRDLYERALSIIGMNFTTIDADDAVRRGLCRAASLIWPTRQG